jgi:hypothetical protein
VNEQPQPAQTVEERLTSIRERLEDSFTQLHLILDVCITCHKALDVQNVEQDESVANVLQRCGSDKLHEQLEELTAVIEELDGRTEYTDDRENAATLDELLGEDDEEEDGDDE